MKNSFQDKIIQKIEDKFRVPERIADKIKNIAEKTKGGYVLFETRPPWDGSPGSWSKLSVAKILFHKHSQSWKIYWMCASQKWEFYGQYKTIDNALKAVKDDNFGCFWG